jgi:hypothetical protein
MNYDLIATGVAEKDIRWLKKNFFGTELASELSVSAIIEPKNQMYLFERFNSLSAVSKHKVYNNLLQASLSNVKLIFCYEGKNFHNEAAAICNQITKLTGCILLASIDFTQTLESYISAVSKYEIANLVVFCLNECTCDTEEIKSILTYAIGRFGRNLCIINHKGLSSDVESFARSMKIPFDSFSKLGISI